MEHACNVYCIIQSKLKLYLYCGLRIRHINDNKLSSCIVNPFMKIKHKNSLYKMIQNQGSLLFIQTVICVLNDLVE